MKGSRILDQQVRLSYYSECTLFSFIIHSLSISLLFKAENLSSQQSHLKEKRKWDSESFERMPKRLRSSLSADGTVGMGHCLMSAHSAQEDTVLTVKKQLRSNKLSRTYRLRQLCESPAGLVNNCDLNSGLINHTESQNKSTTTSDIIQRGKLVIW